MRRAVAIGVAAGGLIAGAASATLPAPNATVPPVGPAPTPIPLPRQTYAPLGAEPGAAARAERQRRALDSRIARAEAALAAEQARAARIEAALAAQRTRLREQQGPVARLLTALATMARRPTLAALVAPATTDDLVHVSAVLEVVLPEVQRRTAALQREVARSRALRASAGAATQAIADGQARLASAQRDLAALGTDGPGDAATRALAIGEDTRDLIDQLTAIGDEQARLEDLVQLPGPPVTASGPLASPAYRVPVGGRLVTGFGEVSRNGVRARGLTFAVVPGARVVAPAAGRIAYARSFRGYRGVVIIDHGAGWNSVIFGLGALAVREGGFVAAGAPIGLAPRSDAAQVTVELRRQGRPVDLAQLV